MLSFARDITERKQAERALQKERDFIDAVLQTAGALVLVLDSRGLIVRVNRAVQDITGYGPEELTGQPVWDAIAAPADAASVKAVFDDLRAGQFPNEHENRIVAKDGSERLIVWSNTALLDAAGSVEFVIGTGMDVTEQRRVDEYQALSARLVEQLNRPGEWLAVIQSVARLIREFTGIEKVGIRLREGEGLPYLVSSGESDDRAAGAFPDRPTDPLMESVCGEILAGKPGASDPSLTEGGTFCVNTAAELGAEQRRRGQPAPSAHGNDAEPHQSVALVPIRANDSVVGLLQLTDSHPHYFEPVTIRFLEQIGASIGSALRRRQAEEKLKVLNETLERRVEERTAVARRRRDQVQALALELTRAEQRERKRLAGVLHDGLQQLLVIAGLRIGTLRKRVQNQDARNSLEGIQDTLEQAIGASRSLTAELSPPVLFDAGLAEGLRWLGRHVGENYGLNVTVLADDAAEPANQDVAVLLFQCVRELLFNVVKHAGVDAAEVSMDSAGDGQIAVCVADQGSGFDLPQAQSDSGTSGGFGLFSIRERLDLLGGQVEVSTARGRGTQVRMTCPKQPPGEADADCTPNTAPQLRKDNGPVRVLIADDHDLMREGLVHLAENEADIEVIGQAVDGHQAVSMARKLHPDVVLMDVSMPGLGGIEATRRIVSQQPNIAVIGISLHVQNGMANGMRAAGAVRYIAKDAPPSQLIAAIRACTPVRRAGSAAGQRPPERRG
jgi:PAS domain S-box-containing protein